MKVEELPGPRGLPLLGNLLQIETSRLHLRAMLEMRMVTAMLLAGFDIERVATPDGEEAKEHLAFTMAPVGLRLKLRGRG